MSITLSKPMRRFKVVLLFTCGLILAALSGCTSMERHTPEAEVRLFVETSQKTPDTEMTHFFKEVNEVLRYPVQTGEGDRLTAELKHNDDDFILSASPLIVGPGSSQASSNQFVLSLMILPTPKRDKEFMRNALTRTLGSPAGSDVWNEPTWFVSGAMITAHDENIAYYYSSSYTGDHLDQIESVQFPLLPGFSAVHHLLLGPWQQYPTRDSLEWKGCLEQWFVGPQQIHPLYYSQDVMLYSPPSSRDRISGLRITLADLGEKDPTDIFQTLLTSWGILGANDLIHSATSELVKSPRQGGTIVVAEGNYVVTLRTVQIVRTTYVLELWRRTDFRRELRQYMARIPRWKNALGKSATDDVLAIADPVGTPCHSQ
jgi:hypothetical protein